MKNIENKIQSLLEETASIIDEGGVVDPKKDTIPKDTKSKIRADVSSMHAAHPASDSRAIDSVKQYNAMEHNLLKKSFLGESSFKGDPKLDKTRPELKPYRDARKGTLLSYRRERELARRDGDHDFANTMQKEGQSFRKTNKI